MERRSPNDVFSLELEDRDARIRPHATDRIIETSQIGRVMDDFFCLGLEIVGDFICLGDRKESVCVYARQQFHLFGKQERISRLDQIE